MPPTDASAIRADAIRRDIFARHRLPEDMDTADALQHMLERAQQDGFTDAGAWANPEERAQARYDYAVRGGDPRGVEQRYDESKYLMDPHTAAYHQKYGRDASFLSGLLKSQALAAQDAERPAYFAGRSPSGPGQKPSAYSLNSALARWDRSHAPLHASGTFQGNTADTDGMAYSVADLVSNRDNLVPQYLELTEVGPVGNAGRLYTSGEAGSYSRAVNQSMALKEFEDRYRLENARTSPVLDLPSSATPDERAERVAYLRSLADQAAPPHAGEAVARNASPFVRDTVDNVYSFLDPSLMLGLAAKAPKAGRLLAGLRQGAVSKAAAAGGARSLAKSMAIDAGADQGINTGINMALTDRTWPQYFFGDGQPVPAKTEAEKQASMAARGEIQEQLARQRQQGNGTYLGVSAPDARMYSRLQKEGRMSAAPPRGW